MNVAIDVKFWPNSLSDSFEQLQTSRSFSRLCQITYSQWRSMTDQNVSVIWNLVPFVLAFFFFVLESRDVLN